MEGYVPGLNYMLDEACAQTPDMLSVRALHTRNRLMTYRDTGYTTPLTQRK